MHLQFSKSGMFSFFSSFFTFFLPSFFFFLYLLCISASFLDIVFFLGESVHYPTLTNEHVSVSLLGPGVEP